MREIRVFGHAQVTVSVVIRVRGDAELTEKEIFQRARRKFGGYIATSETAEMTNSSASKTEMRPFLPTKIRSSMIMRKRCKL